MSKKEKKQLREEAKVAEMSFAERMQYEASKPDRDHEAEVQAEKQKSKLASKEAVEEKRAKCEALLKDGKKGFKSSGKWVDCNKVKAMVRILIISHESRS